MTTYNSHWVGSAYLPGAPGKGMFIDMKEFCKIERRFFKIIDAEASIVQNSG